MPICIVVLYILLVFSSRVGCVLGSNVNVASVCAYARMYLPTNFFILVGLHICINERAQLLVYHGILWLIFPWLFSPVRVIWLKKTSVFTASPAPRVDVWLVVVVIRDPASTAGEGVTILRALTVTVERMRALSAEASIWAMRVCMPFVYCVQCLYDGTMPQWSVT